MYIRGKWKLHSQFKILVQSNSYLGDKAQRRVLATSLKARRSPNLGLVLYAINQNAIKILVSSHPVQGEYTSLPPEGLTSGKPHLQQPLCHPQSAMIN